MSLSGTKDLDQCDFKIEVTTSLGKVEIFISVDESESSHLQVKFALWRVAVWLRGLERQLPRTQTVQHFDLWGHLFSTHGRH